MSRIHQSLAVAETQDFDGVCPVKPAKYSVCSSLILTAAVAHFLGCLPVPASAEPVRVAPVFIAGVEPSQRPAGAPVITEVQKDADWYAAALEGVEPPYPASLRWLEDQGNWFNPFLKPGMTGPYDIRGHH